VNSISFGNVNILGDHKAINLVEVGAVVEGLEAEVPNQIIPIGNLFGVK
jgi:hypothetical protein